MLEKLPDDLLQLIIITISPDNYFNIHGVCSSFRRFLLKIYMDNPILKHQRNDILALCIFKQKFDINEFRICEAIMGKYNEKYLLRSLLQFNILYNDKYIHDRLYYLLIDNNEHEIIKHILNLNNMSFYEKILYYKKHDQINWNDDKEYIFQYVFEFIISHQSVKEIDKLALKAVKNRQIDLFLKIYHTNIMKNLFSCLIKLVEQNNYEIVKYLLDENKYNDTRYYKLWKATNKDDQKMQDLILYHRIMIKNKLITNIII